MGYDDPESVGEALYPRGFRKTFAMLLFFVFTTMPTVFLWQNAPASPEANREPLGVHGSFGPTGFRGAHRPRYGAFASEPPQRTWTVANVLSPFVQLFLATVGGAVSLAMYYPRSGFKRFALLCGPILGFGSMFALALYLMARSEVYRFEIVLVGLIGAMPGLLLYLALVYWKMSRLQAEYVPLESVEPSAGVQGLSGFPQAQFPPGPS